MISSGGVLTTLALGGSAGFGLGFSFLVVRWLATFIAGRMDKKEEQLDAGMQRLFSGMEQEIERLSGECKDLRARISEHGRELADCRRKHAESEAEVMQLKAMMQGHGDARQYAQLIVAAEKQGDKK